MKIALNNRLIRLTLLPLVALSLVACGTESRDDSNAQSSTISSSSSSSSLSSTSTQIESDATVSEESSSPEDSSSIEALPVTEAENDNSTQDIPSVAPFESNEELEPRSAANIVFSGHSLTDAAVPTLRAIANHNGNDLNSIYQSIPGSPIRVRTRGSNPTGNNSWDGYGTGLQAGINLVNEFRSPSQLPSGERYDTLVVTERHDILSVLQWESTVSLVRHFHDRLRESSADGRTYFYQSWLDINKENPAPWIDYEKDSLMTWECTVSKVNQTLVSEGLPTNLRTLAAGWALANMVERALSGAIPGLQGSSESVLQEIFSDNVHLNPLGNFFVGAYAYSEVFGQNPAGFPIPSGISDETGNALLLLAWELVQEYHSRGNSNSHNMAACRSHIASNICEPYWVYIFDRPGMVDSCQSFFGNESDGNPFRDFDPNMTVWAAP